MMYGYSSGIGGSAANGNFSFVHDDVVAATASSSSGIHNLSSSSFNGNNNYNDQNSSVQQFSSLENADASSRFGQFQLWRRYETKSKRKFF